MVAPRLEPVPLAELLVELVLELMPGGGAGGPVVWEWVSSPLLDPMMKRRWGCGCSESTVSWWV